MLPFLGLLLAMILWGSSFVAMKYSFQGMHPLVVILGRMVVATLCFLPFFRSFLCMGVRRQHLVPILVMCLCEPCGYFLFEAAALSTTSASQAAMITILLPLLVALSAGVLLGERISLRTVCGFLLAIGGGLWLGLGAPITTDAPHPVLGNFLEFMAMICATGYTILMKRLSKELHPFFLTGVQALVGALFFLPVLLWVEVEVAELSMGSLSAVLYLGSVVSVGAYGLYNYGISRIPASQAVAFVNLIPVFALLFGAVLLDERLAFWQWVAGGLVFAGVLVCQYPITAPAKERAA